MRIGAVNGNVPVSVNLKLIENIKTENNTESSMETAEILSKESDDEQEEGAEDEQQQEQEESLEGGGSPKKKSTRKKRSINWEEAEKNCLLEAVKTQVELIENRSVDSKSAKAKRFAWSQITKQFNANNFRHRSQEQIQVQWRSMKTFAKQKYQQKSPKATPIEGLPLMEFMEELMKESVTIRPTARTAKKNSPELLDLDDDTPLAALPNSTTTTNNSDDTMPSTSLAALATPPPVINIPPVVNETTIPSPTIRKRKKTKQNSKDKATTRTSTATSHTQPNSSPDEDSTPAGILTPESRKRKLPSTITIRRKSTVSFKSQPTATNENINGCGGGSVGTGDSDSGTLTAAAAGATAAASTAAATAALASIPPHPPTPMNNLLFWQTEKCIVELQKKLLLQELHNMQLRHEQRMRMDFEEHNKRLRHMDEEHTERMRAYRDKFISINAARAEQAQHQKQQQQHQQQQNTGSNI